MQEEIPKQFMVDATRKWLALAQRRKAYLVELYESGRWRLYFNQDEFVARMREAIHMVDRWSATEQASRDEPAYGCSLGAENSARRQDEAARRDEEEEKHPQGRSLRRGWSARTG